MFKTYYEVLKVSTSSRFELVDITSSVENIVRKSGIKNGICLVFAPHATAAIIANEHETGLISDIQKFIKDLTKPDANWSHNIIDDNAHAHIGSAIIGSERIFPVIDGRIVRGTWQNIFLVEMDGPRSSRTIVVMVIGES
ncbi:protein of unknown function UPF0047 [Ignisphaera aggregans DSM 17230]|uniref:YjbQ family protein n=1 Tax=Ignisphaera aggregans (strain DSM 17230 / JCM 13409 / AQ1.S1) TaxID=583356 RepID=E0SNZ3_IGNAA|nr:protein of unknown function UPF0047 [Ignisphaera aggregans DSM 17230]